MGKPTAQQVADYFVYRLGEGDDDQTNLKIQKLLYYANGYCLAMRGESLFDDVIEAWKLGPVVPSVYTRFKKHGRSDIPSPDHFDIEFLPEDLELYDAILATYGKIPGPKLVDMTHRESPWLNAYDGQDRCTQPISARLTTKHFDDLLKGNIASHPRWPAEQLHHQRRPAITRRLARNSDKAWATARRTPDVASFNIEDCDLVG